MRKFILYLIILAIGFGLGAGAFRLFYKNSHDSRLTSEENGISVNSAVSTDALIKPEFTNKQLIDFAYTTLLHIRMRDYSSLSETVHPEYGLVFSPGSTVNLSSNKCFSKEQVSAFSEDTVDYVWGVKESGEPIELTVEEYFSEYVYIYDYLNAEIIGINEIVRSGNALENVREVFPEAYFIDFYISGENQNIMEGNISWTILRLVFEEYEGELKLTAVIHSEYTA
ncbi:MAG: hypothetical protein GX254_04050 [Clostridiales bacterium]|jgi:hypothetical protein|nr:hypothetical protein [Clostridiales bacterium]